MPGKAAVIHVTVMRPLNPYHGGVPNGVASHYERAETLTGSMACSTDEARLVRVPKCSSGTATP